MCATPKAPCSTGPAWLDADTLTHGPPGAPGPAPTPASPLGVSLGQRRASVSKPRSPLRVNRAIFSRP